MPSSNLSLSLPINPLSRAKVVSAGAIRKPRKHSRVWLYAQYVRRSKLISLSSESKWQTGESPRSGRSSYDESNYFLL
jgi:hypothetical protein